MTSEEFNLKYSNFGDTIVISDITSKIQALEQVRSVSKFQIYNIYGTVDGRSYSNVQFDIPSHTFNGIVRFNENMVWEVKFWAFDITGRIS